MSWAIPVFRAFGIQVKVHLFFFVVTIGLFLRQVAAKDNPIWWVDVFLFTIPLLFGIILLHEFGHCFAARKVDGDAREILIWPLGGLAFVETPHHWRAHFVVSAGGPAVNVLICLVAAAPLFAAGFVPNLNPLANPFVSEMHNYRNGRDYTSEYGFRAYEKGTNEQVPVSKAMAKATREQEDGLRDRIAYRPADARQLEAWSGGERTVAPVWAVWLNRAFWLSWLLFLFNLLPAYPLDGGQILQALVWARTDFRRGVTVAAYSGFVVSIAFLIVSIAANEALFMGLALFILYSSSMKLHALDTEEGPFGYDFSAGYTSLERDDDRPPRRKRQGILTRWLQARKARKIMREIEQRARDDERMDEILAKIAASGKASLTDDERRFLDQFSSRYRHRS